MSLSGKVLDLKSTTGNPVEANGQFYKPEKSFDKIGWKIRGAYLHQVYNFKYQPIRSHINQILCYQNGWILSGAY